MSRHFLKATTLGVLLSGLGIQAGAQTLAPQSSPRVTSALYNCNMDFHASGKSIYIGIGFTELSGEGTLSCYDPGTGVVQRIPLKITARGPGAGLGVTGLNLSGGATGVGISGSPEKLLGHYAVLRGNAAVGIGASAGAGLRLSNGAAVINVTFEAQSGLGAGVDLLWVDIKAADRKDSPAGSPPVASQPVVESSNLSAVEKLPVSNIPTTVVELHGDQPIQIVDSNGKVIQLIYVKQK